MTPHVPEPNPGGATPDRPTEAQALIDALLDHRLPEEGRRRLEQMIGADPAVARLYILSVHLLCCLPVHVARPRQTSLGDDDGLRFDDDGIATGRPLDEAMILPALRDEDPRSTPHAARVARPAPPAPAVNRPAIRDAPRRAPGARRLIVPGTLAALLLVGLCLTWSRWGSGPPAVVTATAGAVAEGFAGPGAGLAKEASVRLTEGALELTFASGATVIVQAPSQFRVLDRNGLALQSGTIYGHVPASAVGFRATAPGLTVVDRGTNFGLRTTTGDTAAEVHVIAGVVDVTGDDAQRQATSAPVRLTAGQAVTHAQAAGGGPPVPIAFAGAGFTRNLHDVRMVVPTHGTGAGLAGGAIDRTGKSSPCLATRPGSPGRRPSWSIPGPSMRRTGPRPVGFQRRLAWGTPNPASTSTRPRLT